MGGGSFVPLITSFTADCCKPPGQSIDKTVITGPLPPYGFGVFLECIECRDDVIIIRFKLQFTNMTYTMQNKTLLL